MTRPYGRSPSGTLRHSLWPHVCTRAHHRVSDQRNDSIRNVPEVCSIFCATANPVEIIVIKTEQGRGVPGVVDGAPPQGVEGPDNVAWRRDLLRKIGYKR